jgi:nucleoside-diphosphate-sugar epimerase
LNLLKFICEAGIKKFVYVSSSLVYGHPEDLPVEERHIISPANSYVLSKFIGESFCENVRIQQSKQVISLRISSPYGPYYTHRTVIPTFIEKAISSQDITVFGTGRRTQDFIYINDVIEGIIKFFFSSTSGIFNLGSGKETTMISLAQTILSIFFRIKIKDYLWGRV